MAVDGAALREIPPPPNAPRYRAEDGAPIRYFQAPDGRVAGFVGDGRGGWTAVVAPRDPSAFSGPSSPSAPLMRVAPGVEAPMTAAEAPPGTPRTTAAGETIHWFAGPGGGRMGFVRDGDQWRPAMREPSATRFPAPALPAISTPSSPAPPATPPAAPAPAPAAPGQDLSTPPWMRVPDDGSSARGEEAPADEPAEPEGEPEKAATGGIRGWARNWWEEAGRNTEAKRARKRGARRKPEPEPGPKPEPGPGPEPDTAARARATPAANREIHREESPAVRRLHRRRRWAGRLLVAVAGLGIALVVLTLVTDLINAIHPAPQKVEQVVRKSGNGGLSSSELAASSFAVQFAWAYLTYDQNNPQQHAAAIAPFLGPNVSDSWNGSGTQEVATAQAMSVTRSRGGVVDVDVAAYVASFPAGAAEQLRWLYISVPVQVNGTQLTIAAMPTAIPPPRAGTPSAGQLSPTVSNEDTQLTQQLTDPMQSFFGAWASGNATQLAYLETPNAGIQPLGSTQEKFVRLAGFQVEQGSGATRTSLALVTWSDAVTGAQFTQPYTVTWQNSGSRWLISSVRPGVG